MPKYRLLHIPSGKYVIKLIQSWSRKLESSFLAHNTYWLDGVDERIYDKDLMDFKYIWYKKIPISKLLREHVAQDLYGPAAEYRSVKEYEFEWIKVR